MLTLIKITVIALLNFIYITIFKFRKIKKMPKNESIMTARKELKLLSEKIIKIAKINLEVIYVDKKAYDNINIKDGVVIISNHESNVDIPVIVSGLDIPVGFVAKKEMESWPFYSLWMKLSACVFLDRTNPRNAIKSIKKAVNTVKNGFPIVIFPEGGRTQTGKMGNFKKGSFRLATDVNGIILPITVDGTFFVQNQKNIKINANKKVKLIIGKPIYLKTLTENEIKELSTNVRNIIKDKKSIKE